MREGEQVPSELHGRPDRIPSSVASRHLLPEGEGKRDQRSLFMYCKNGSSWSSTITLWPSLNEAR